MFFRSIAIVEASASHAAYARFQIGRGGQLRLERVARESLVVPPESEAEWSRKIAAAMQALQNRVNQAGPVVLILPAHVLLMKLLKTPRVDAAAREGIVRFEAHQKIPYPLSDVEWGSAVVGETAAGCDVALFAAKRDTIDPLCAAAEAAGFVPRYLLPGPLANLAAARRVRSTPGTLLVDIGARSTTLLYLEKECAHLRSFSLGGNNVTQQIAAARICDFAAAEELKFGGKDCPALEQATAKLVTRLAQEITRSVLFFQDQSGAEPPQQVVLTGGCSRLPHLSGVLAKRLNLPVATLDWAGAVEIGFKVNLVDGVFPSAGLIGAAALQVSTSQPTVNLLPSRLRTREVMRRRQPWLAAAAAAVVTALLPPIFHFQSVIGATRRQTAAVERDLVPLRERADRNRANLKKIAQSMRQIEVLQDLRDRRFSWLTLLAGLQQRLSEVEDVWLDRMQVVPVANARHPAAGALPAIRIAVSGRMLDKADPLSKVSETTYRRVNGLLASLAAAPFVAKVEGEAFDNSQPGVLRFNFTLVADPSRPL
jgi:type IV pilus assembly protein PilM